MFIARRSFGSTVARLSGKAAAAAPTRSAAAPAAAIGTKVTPRMTKIVCTLGPSTETAEKVGELVEAGMSVARLNFSHVHPSDYSEPLEKLRLVRGASGMHHTLGRSGGAVPPNLRAVLVDTKGPEIRTGKLQGGVDVAEIVDGSEVILTLADVSEDNVEETGFRLHVDYPSLASTVQIGGSVLLDDGLIALEVTGVDHATSSVTTIARNSGPIKARKGVNLPGAVLDLPALTEKDKADLKWAVQEGADFVAASFIRSAANVRSCIAHLERCCDDHESNGIRPLRPLVISKIESEEGVDNFDEILEESDGIMVARGDLGVEIPFEKVFAAQKMMVEKCNEAGKPVIVATQMLDSMMRQPRPTRAEVTDVGTAVLDGADSVMLSGETAAGKYPISSINAMQSVLKEADALEDTKLRRRNRSLKFGTASKNQYTIGENVDCELDAVAAGAVNTAAQRGLDIQCIVCITMTGSVARAIARHQPNVPVIAFCYDPQVARRLQLNRSVMPVMLQAASNPFQEGTRMGLLRTEAIRTAKEAGLVTSGDRIVFVDRNRGKSTDSFSLGTNMKVFTVG